MFTKLIHLTDPHIVPPGETLCALDPAARLTSAVDEINRLHADAFAVVLTGDLSYHGLHPAYELAREILARLEVPCHLLIGNHDDRSAFRQVFPETPVDPGGFVQYVVESPVGARRPVCSSTGSASMSARNATAGASGLVPFIVPMTAWPTPAYW